MESIRSLTEHFLKYIMLEFIDKYQTPLEYIQFLSRAFTKSSNNNNTHISSPMPQLHQKDLVIKKQRALLSYLVMKS
jgi:hypothetical protein